MPDKDELERLRGSLASLAELIVFVVVLVSVIGQGTLVPSVARALHIPMRAAGS